MNPAKTLLDWFRGRKPKKQASGESTIASLIGPSGRTPGSWGGDQVEQVQHCRLWVYAAISAIQTLSTKQFPSVLIVDNTEKAKGKKKVPQSVARKALNRDDTEDFVYAGRRDPLTRLLKNPNEPDTWHTFLEELILFKELTGDAYIWKVPYINAPGLAELWIIPSYWVYPISGTQRLIDYYEVRCFGQTARFEPEELVKISYKNPTNKIVGLSPLQANSELIDTSEIVVMSRFYSLINGANLGTVITNDGSRNPSEEELRRFESKFLAKFQGPEGFQVPSILPVGLKVERPPEGHELALQQSADQLRDQVLAIWKLPKTIVGINEAVNRATFDGSLYQTYTNVINPRLARLGEILTEQLAIPHFGEEYQITWPDLSPNDRVQELAEWRLLTERGVYTANEIRSWMGLDPIEGGDEPIAPLQTAPASWGGGDGGLSDAWGNYDRLQGMFESPSTGLPSPSKNGKH
jgi:phage portal protein BeeE